MEPYISIIIPVYNVDNYLCDCLDSILHWQFSAWEAILIDDGSLDKSGVICDEYAAKDLRFKVIHKSNEGVAVARNIGLDIAKGEWCWFVDSDDMIDPTLKVEMDALEGKDIVLYDVKIFKDGDRPSVVDAPMYYREYKEKKTFFLTHCSYLHMSMWFNHKFWRRDGIHVIRFTKGIKLGEDIEFMRKCELLSENPLKVNHINYYYRYREGSAYHQKGIHQQVVNDSFWILENIYDFIVKYKIEITNEMLFRFTNLASNIPAHAVIGKFWKVTIRRKFRILIHKYEDFGVHLTSSHYIWLAINIPWLLPILTYLINIRCNKGLAK